MTMLSVLKNNARHIVASSSIATALLIGAPLMAQAAILSGQLDLGSTGADVTALQTYLAGTPYYPEGLVTGYFGVLTQAAVSRFQSANEIPPVGRVGPITLAFLNGKMDGLPKGDVYAPILSNVRVDARDTSATISWNTNEQAKGVVYYDQKPLTELEGSHSVIISGAWASSDTALHTAHQVELKNLLPDTKYYYDIYVTDINDNASMSMQTSFTTDR